MSSIDEKNLLCSINSPEDLRKLPIEKLPMLAQQVRKVLINTVSKTGGHLASSLGAVELTIALHYAFKTPEDKICWDVGHQSYTHKLLTGRQEKFQTLRCYKGVSGFPKKEESEYDPFSVGHAGTSISSALGIVEANRLSGSNAKTIAVIGDGSLTSGLALEGLNQAGTLDKNMIIVLNDNEYSISPNVGAISSFLSRKLAGKSARAVRKRLRNFLTAIPYIGDYLYHVAKRIEDIYKALVTPGILFEALGFEYLGPLQGHNIPRLIEVFQDAAALENPMLLHVITKKGMGYLPAEKNPSAFHGVGPFEPATGKPKPKAPAHPSYTSVFSDAMVELGEKDEKVIAITAAMPAGTGLEKFGEKFPKRCFDVGIAEQHGITFASGLASKGFKPIAAIYSTFLQRSYDQIIHDVALQNLPVIFALDRGGLVGSDGPTHHGVFDLSYLRHIPRLVIMAPKDENELRHMFFSALKYNKPVAIRYPRGAGFGVKIESEMKELPFGKGEVLAEGSDVTLVGIGNMATFCLQAAKLLLEKGIKAAVINARFVKPLDADLIVAKAIKTGHLVTVEENAAIGGFGAGVLEALSEAGAWKVKTKVIGVPDKFIEHGGQDELRNEIGLTPQKIADATSKLLGKK